MSFSVAVGIRRRRWKISESLLRNLKLHAFKGRFAKNKYINKYSRYCKGFPLPPSQRQDNGSALYLVNNILYPV